VEQSLPLYQETVRLAHVGLRLETVLPSQRLSANAEVAKVELEALKLRNPIATQMEALNELMGRPVDTPFRIAGIEQIVEERIDPGTLAEGHLNSFFREVRHASLRVQQADLDSRVKRSEYFLISAMAPAARVSLKVHAEPMFNNLRHLRHSLPFPDSRG
jgi:outer membrane protein TolC